MWVGQIRALGLFLLLATTPSILTAGTAYGRFLIDCAAVVEVAQTTSDDGASVPIITNRQAVIDAFLEQASTWDGTSFVESNFPISVTDWQTRQHSVNTDLTFAQKLEECSKYATAFGVPYELAD